MNTIRLYLVTDDAAEACLYVLGISRREIPHWVAIADTTDKIADIPPGGRCIGAWFKQGPLTDCLRGQWDVRRLRDRDVVGCTEKFLNNLEDWRKRRMEKATPQVTHREAVGI